MPKFLFITLFLALPALAAEYVHPQRGFTLDFDDTRWEVVPPTAQAAGADVDKKMSEQTLVTLQRKNADDKYRARFSVVTDDAKKFEGKGKPVLEAYKDHAVEFLKGQRFHVLSTEMGKLPGVNTPVVEVVGNQRDFGLTFRQIIFVREGDAYLLTAAARTKKYEEYLPELKKLAESLKFKKGKTR